MGCLLVGRPTLGPAGSRGFLDPPTAAQSQKNPLAQHSENPESIEAQYGQADRVWVMDRGIPTEETLQAMRTSARPIYYLVGTPRGKLT